MLIERELRQALYQNQTTLSCLCAAPNFTPSKVTGYGRLTNFGRTDNYLNSQTIQYVTKKCLGQTNIWTFSYGETNAFDNHGQLIVHPLV